MEERKFTIYFPVCVCLSTHSFIDRGDVLMLSLSNNWRRKRRSQWSQKSQWPLPPYHRNTTNTAASSRSYMTRTGWGYRESCTPTVLLLYSLTSSTPATTTQDSSFNVSGGLTMLRAGWSNPDVFKFMSDSQFLWLFSLSFASQLKVNTAFRTVSKNLMISGLLKLYLG